MPRQRFKGAPRRAGSRSPTAPLADHVADEVAGRCRRRSGCGHQVYDPRAEQEQATRIRGLEQQLRRSQLRRKQLASMEQMARSQATQLRTTLDMLLAPDDLDLDGAPSRCAQYCRRGLAQHTIVRATHLF